MDEQTNPIIEIERLCLSAIMVNPDCLEQCTFLRHGHFIDPGHQRVYNVMYGLRTRGKPSTLELVIHGLASMGELENVGGEGAITSIYAMGADSANVRHYAEEVVSDWTRRKLWHLAHNAHAKKLQVDDIVTGAEDIFRTAMGATNRVPVSRVAPDPDRPPKTGIAMPLATTNRTTYVRGMPVGQSSVVSSYTKGGKTAMALQCAYHALRHGLVAGVVYGTFADLGHHDLEDRLMKQLTGYATAMSATEHGGFEAREAWVQTAQYLATLPFHVYDASASDSGTDVEAFIAYCDQTVTHGHNPANLPWLAIADHAQEITTRLCRIDDELTTAKVVATKLNRWAMRNQGVMMILSQITEGVAGARDRTKGSRVWEEKAGWVSRIRTVDGDNKRRIIDVPFNRFGASGVSVTVGWDASKVSFYDLQ